MDAVLLRDVVSETAGRLVEQELLRCAFLGNHRYLLRFATPTRDNLLVSVRPDLPRLHLTPLRTPHREAQPDLFAAFADRELAGARLLVVDMMGGDRIVRMLFRLPSAGAAGAAGAAGTTRTLVAELLGRSSNLLLLDDADRVLAFARDLHSAFRAPVAGSAYDPPRPRLPGTDSVGPSDGSRPAAVRHAVDGPPGGGSVVYSIRPLDAFREGEHLGRDDLFARAAPVDPPPLGSDGAPLVATPFASPSAAAQTAFDLVERLRDFEDERARHQTRVRREIDRLTTLDRRLGEDLDRARGSDRDRRRAEALLAGLSVAKVAGNEATVPDPESADGAAMVVPIDPSMTLQDNAQRLFARWKKGKRAMSAIATRRAAIGGRLEEWRGLQPLAAAAASPADLKTLREKMERLGLVHAERATKRSPEAAPRAAPTRVRRHTTADGFVVLVGRSGPENDTLTFKVASPWDFWMHAAGTPGAHVVVRNPGRLASLPDGTLRAAAEIAAWYSGAKGEGKVEVHYTQRKHVHKRRGMPAGQVLVRKFRSIQVAPRLPQPAIEDV